MSGKAFTSYDETIDMANDFIMLGNDPANALHDTYLNTKEFAEEQKAIPPENTKANPADRVKSFRKGISWNTAEEKNIVLASEKFKKSAMALIHCVLSSKYGERVTIEATAIAEINAQIPGAKFFLAEMVKALYGEPNENINGINITRKKIFYIYHNNMLMGLFSPTGPIPSVENEFSFIKFPPVNEDEIGLQSIIESLDGQERKLLKFWLDRAISEIGGCKLFDEILANLENIAIDASIENSFEITELDSDILRFPTLKYFSEKLFSEVITILPVVDREHAKFGYDLPALTVEIGVLCYAFIPPLSEIAVEYTKNDNFVVENIFIDREQSSITGSEKDYVTIQCDFKVNNMELPIRKKYIFENIRSIKGFPTLSLYGPAPKFGWIARRNIDGEKKDVARYLRQLKYDIINIDSAADVEILGIEFEFISDVYSLYSGAIPVWAGIMGKGNFLGAIPLRAVSADKENDWEKTPVFTKKRLPQNGKMIVAVDIGSSRSVVLFKREESDQDTDTLIEKDRVLGVYLTSSLDSDPTRDAEFETLYFQLEKQDEKIAGKTPVGVFIPSGSNENSGAPILYKSGKLFFIDPKNISVKKDEKIISDIKSGIGRDISEDKARQYQMNLLIQGLAAMIIEQSLRMQRSEIEIRLAYLADQYYQMNEIWRAALDAITRKAPTLKISYNFWLPESLAIANKICHENGFHAGSGAAFVDIGDLSTDIALFQNKITTDTSVELKNNYSMRFAGKIIIIEPLWEYINFSNGGNIDHLFHNTTPEAETVLRALKTKLEERPKEHIITHLEVRNDLLCLIKYLKNDVPIELRNLFDIGCLAEMIILKRLIERENIKEGGEVFYIHLFGGGSSFFKGNSDEFNWNKVLVRPCKVENASGDGNMLARGLFGGKHRIIQAADDLEKTRVEDYNIDAPDRRVANDAISQEELDEKFKQGYIEFVQEAKNLHRWLFMARGSGNVSVNGVFNISGDGDSAQINDMASYTLKYGAARDFANEVIIYDKNGRIDDIEIKKYLFAYKMAVLRVVEFYKGE